ADMYLNSTLPEDEIEHERQVITQEIGMSQDTPDDLVFDNYYETAYKDQALGMPILGHADIIGGMTKDTLQNHITRFYTPERTVMSAAGNLNHDEFCLRVAELFSGLPANTGEPNKPAK